MRVYFEPENCILSNDKKSIKITLQEGRCLDYLVRNEGKIIRREKLLEECWVKRGVTVSDSAVRQSLYRLRRAFEDAGLPANTLTTQARKGHILQAGYIILLTDLASHNRADIESSVPPVVKQDTYRHTNHYSTVTSLLPIAKFLSLSVILFLAGFYTRQQNMITEVNYHQAEEKEGRFYFYRKNQAHYGSAAAKISYWLDNKLVNASDMKYVYLNNSRTGNTSFYLCNGEIGNEGSNCTSVTVIGDYHS
ncbi:winged helix-turn-helix domain-containing protein [Erwinia amylovora]|uniref:winged helix-turn-helix domain-containing protein n=1 Tax=Erwinia amylovora TaxID=552 RepID=UPI0014444349|nr:winged helix-turn-helix domain-containing protein [Erwinia amylovora]